MLARSDMRAALIALVCLTLAACSTGTDSRIAYVPPSMPTAEAMGKGIKKAAEDAKLKPPIETSDLRQVDHGPGHFMLCMRAMDPKSNLAVTYTVFFENEDYKGLRLPVILDECEKQSYRPLP
jgi:hypothetical protein